MKIVRMLLSVLLALALLFTLCACGGRTAAESPSEESDGSLASAARDAAENAGDVDLSAWAGVYSFLCARFSAAYMSRMLDYDGPVPDIPDQYVDMPEMADETVTLEPGGTGYLYWGDDNQGPIDSWTMDGNALQFQAGVAVMDGTIINGIMTVELDDGFCAIFALSGADTSGIDIISIDDYFALLFGSEEENAGAETVAAEDIPGEYTVFAVQNEGYLVYADVLEVSSTITLAADGSEQIMTNGDESMDIVSWSLDGNTLTIVLADDSSAEAVAHDGIIELDIWGTGEMILIYTKEGADTSAYSPMTLEELLAAYETAVPDSRLYALWESLDAAAGVHLSYDRHTDYMDADQSFDVHGKDGVYYSRRTSYVSGYENTVITFFRDGTAYNLDPEDMTGIIATTTTSSYIMANIMGMDGLYSGIQSCAQRTDYIEETRELDGTSYTVEAFPATDYTPEAAFYFDDAGQLVYYLEGAPVIESTIDVGETFYTIHAIDGAVDEALFDISGYEIADS